MVTTRIRPGRDVVLCFPCNYYVINAIDKFNVDPEKVAEYYRKYGK